MRRLQLFLVAVIFLYGNAALSQAPSIEGSLYKPLSGVSAETMLLHDTMLQQRQAEDLPAAINTADSIVTSLTVGPEDQLALALENLATLQMEAGELSAAIDNLQNAIEHFEHSISAYAPELVQALYSLGAVQRVMGQYDEARESFRRAQHIVHRHDGVYSLDQLKILDQLTLVELAKGELADADREQDFYYLINERTAGKGSLDLLPALSKHARYLGKVGRFQEAVGRYREALGIIADQYGSEDIRAIEYWQGIAEVRLNQKEFLNYGPSLVITEDQYNNKSTHNQLNRNLPVEARLKLEEAEYALAQVVNIINQQEESDLTDQIMALIHLGDIHTVSNNPTALDYYRQALELMNSRPELDQLKNDVFGVPTRIYPKTNYILTLDVYDEPEQPFFAEVEFLVSAAGRPTDVVISSTNMPTVERKLLKRMIYLYRYRPRLIEGEFASSDMSINQYFQARIKPRPKHMKAEGD
jgi:tetratricopeptide (TPR) repeat protein